jgi:hypothetical protein
MANLLRLGKKRINSFVLLSTFRNFAGNKINYYEENTISIDDVCNDYGVGPAEGHGAEPMA